MADRTIPLVDLSKFVNGTAEERKAFVEALGKAFHETGFVGVVGHGISKDLIERFYTNAKSFFNLPIKTKRKYEIEGLAGQRGYTSFGKEHAKQSEVADLKEFYQIGQFVSEDHPLRASYPRNVAVAETPSFLPWGKQLYQGFEEAGSHLLRAIALYLNLPENYFAGKIDKGNSILRAIHYPPTVSYTHLTLPTKA